MRDGVDGGKWAESGGGGRIFRRKLAIEGAIFGGFGI